ncbi:MAG: hydrogenase small subunit [Sedimentisphaeraceae bacterium JB056]
MRLSRREFLKLASATGVAMTMPFAAVEKALAGSGDPRVIWLQGQCCSGCSVSLLNSVNLTTVDDLLINKINLEYHSTLIASAGDLAFKGATGPHPSEQELIGIGDNWLSSQPNDMYDLNGDAKVNLIDFSLMAAQGYILVVEGAIPTDANGDYCHIGSHLTMLEAFDILSKNADSIISIGTCASFGGISAASPNPTAAKSVTDALAYLGRSKTVINIPGCPAHPDWFVGTVVKLLNGDTVALDSNRRPMDYYAYTVHQHCPYRSTEDAHNLGESGCLEDVGCRGKSTRANCPILKWNSPAKGTNGVNWCVQARTPCHGCTEPTFPDGKTPFYKEDD